MDRCSLSTQPCSTPHALGKLPEVFKLYFLGLLGIFYRVGYYNLCLHGLFLSGNRLLLTN